MLLFFADIVSADGVNMDNKFRVSDILVIMFFRSPTYKHQLTIYRSHSEPFYASINLK